MIKRNFLMLSFVLILSGCATYATGPLFMEAPPSPDKKSTLYIFRAKTIEMGTPKVKINGEPFVDLKAMGYSYAYLPPGIYRISFDYGAFAGGGFITEVEMKEGKDLYVLYSGNGMANNVVEMTKKQASEQIKNYRYVDPINKDFKSP